MNTFPPVLTKEEIDILKKESADYCPAHGILMRPHELTIVPHTLFPSPFPVELFNEAMRIQPVFNSMFDFVSSDSQFLMESLADICDQDEFTRNLVLLFKNRENRQPIKLGIHRSDYMLDSKGDAVGMKQIEFNTISSSFSSHSSSVSELHRFMAHKTSFFSGVKLEQLPPNNSRNAPVKGITKAWELYGSKNAIVLFVVQKEEGNVFDQRQIEYAIFKT
jgi:glutathione synthetase